MIVEVAGLVPARAASDVGACTWSECQLYNHAALVKSSAEFPQRVEPDTG